MLLFISLSRKNVKQKKVKAKKKKPYTPFPPPQPPTKVSRLLVSSAKKMDFQFYYKVSALILFASVVILILS